jgi:hypothetical protein
LQQEVQQRLLLVDNIDFSHINTHSTAAANSAKVQQPRRPTTPAALLPPAALAAPELLAAARLAAVALAARSLVVAGRQHWLLTLLCGFFKCRHIRVHILSKQTISPWVLHSCERPVLFNVKIKKRSGGAGSANGAAGVVGRLGCCILALLAAAVEWVLI